MIKAYSLEIILRYEYIILSVTNKIGKWNSNPEQAVSLCANAHEKGINPSVLLPAMVKYSEADWVLLSW